MTPTHIAADGVSRTSVEASIDKDAEAAFKTLTFKTSAGKFFPSTSANGQEMKLGVDAAGKASVLQLTADPSTLAADNATVTRIIATVPNNLPSGRRSVQFNASIGAFIGRDVVEADASNRAVILYKSDVEGNAIISGTLDGNRAETTVVLRPALPETIFVSPAAPQVKATDTASVRIAVRLLRAVGQVSDNTLVSFLPLDSSGQRVGIFSNIELSKNGDVSANYFPGTTTYRGTVTIRATVAGSPAVGTAEIVIVDP